MCNMRMLSTSFSRAHSKANHPHGILSYNNDWLQDGINLKRCFWKILVKIRLQLLLCWKFREAKWILKKRLKISTIGLPPCYNNIPTNFFLLQDVLTEFYTSTLLVTIAMFIERMGRASLLETFNESIKVKKVIINLKGNPWIEEKKVALLSLKQHSQT